MSKHRWFGLVLALASAGCLEGDPNPYTEKTGSAGSSSTGVTPGTACSQSSGTNVVLTLTNRSTHEFRIMWVDYSCQEQFTRLLEPGQSYTTNTQPTNTWRLRDTSTNLLLFEYVTTAVASQVVDVNVP